MAGHSKWANIKHRKAAQDAKKGASYQRLTKAVIAAAKAGGGDPNNNFRLKVAVERARAGNVPVDNIERAIKKATGGLDGVIYEEITYEGYGPSGVAVMVEAITDNRNRTAPEMRLLFTKSGGAIGELGCVAWNFDRRGTIQVIGQDIVEETLLDVAIESGADDMEADDGIYTIMCDPASLSEVAQGVKEAGYPIEKMEIEMLPKNTVSISSKEDAVKLLAMIDRFEEHDDVQNVYANFDIPEEILAQLD